MLRKALRAAACLTAAACCHGGEQEDRAERIRALMDGMEDGQRLLARRRRLEDPLRMSLERMFPDERLRALAKAAGRGRTSRIDRLVAEGVDVNALGRNGTTALFWSFRRKSLRGFRRLLEHGADPHVVMDSPLAEDDWTVVHHAAAIRNTAYLAALLRHGADPDVRGGPRWETPLFTVATYDGPREAYVMLLDAGAEVDATKRQILDRTLPGTTVAQAAALGGDMDMLHELLERGADYTRRYGNGQTIGMAVARHCARSESKKGRKAESCERVVEWLRAREVEVPLDRPPEPGDQFP